MAQNNPINESASLSSTGSANAPLNTNASYTQDTTNNNTSNPSSSNNKIAQAGEFTKNMLAAAHGAGEKLRGDFNSTVDKTFNENEGVVKNQRIANAGESEFSTGQFAHSTKN